ncbi:hypothetical protein L596_008708 [Steinernema carpocapsae]|uniref:Uncharacterized protein n=1 Tax=Steinernema carpocapsae TaxID=34508 RepID=A0A4U5PDB1_STECR|nr:hypothetical protein L596_008708 [Steinernema carpocapsae]
MNRRSAIALGEIALLSDLGELIKKCVLRWLTLSTISGKVPTLRIRCCGLQLCRFGIAVSLLMYTGSAKPDSCYDAIKSNKERGLHMLYPLDMATEEQTVENMIKGREIYEPPRYINCADREEAI